MATDPYSSFGEGMQGGIGMVANLATIRAKRDENTREQKKAQFDQMISTLGKHAEILKSDAPMPIRQAAANGILGVYREHGADMGIDPKALPANVNFDEDLAKTFASQITSMNKLYEKGIIGKNDYRVGMWKLADDWKTKTGKEDPSVMKMAGDVADKDKARMTAVIGDQRIALQETFPGSGEFAPMKTTEGTPIAGPAAQRVEVVHPPTAEERGQISTIKSDLDTMGYLKDNIPTSLVGPLASRTMTPLAEITDTLSPQEQKWLATLDLQETKDKKFYAGTAQSKQELKGLLKSVPNRGMPVGKLKAAIQANIENKARVYKRVRETLLQAGIRDPGALPLEQQLMLYQKHAPAAAAPAATGADRPALDTIFFGKPVNLGEGE